MDYIKDLVNRLDFNDYYSTVARISVPSLLKG